MKSTLVTCLLACCLLTTASAQHMPLTEEEYHALWAMTKAQTDSAQLNEHQYIRLREINRRILTQYWNEVEALRLEVALLHNKLRRTTTPTVVATHGTL
jgi:hypothetical protein